MPLVKKLIRVGESRGVILDRAILRRVDIEPDSEVEVSVEGSAIVIRPQRYAGDDARAAGRKVIRKNASNLLRQRTSRGPTTSPRISCSMSSASKQESI